MFLELSVPALLCLLTEDVNKILNAFLVERLYQKHICIVFYINLKMCPEGCFN